ncbi:sigma-70 family RNA polymerase sigma factor [Amycolatopsis sp. SID8362]|nr:sigma-70 family RNA polymerase sigma factor [Amycolatopsis sp. SID8362]NED39290.1 sigma-70 family RNA polymerase sigma factor [Amycolatopsis sp. SID8362]
METTDPPSDEVLLAALRAGDTHACELLFRRHAEPLRRMATGWTHHPAEPDDLVSETFTRVMAIVQKGGGPREDLRPYLVVTMRNLLSRWRRKSGAIELWETIPDSFIRSSPTPPLPLGRADERLVWSAFLSLPRRWRTVLWRTEVEGSSLADAGLLLDLSPNSAAALAKRAREGLRQAYLQAQVPESDASRCREPRRQLGAWVRGALPRRRSELLGRHIAACAPCQTVAALLRTANCRLPERPSD